MKRIFALLLVLVLSGCAQSYNEDLLPSDIEGLEKTEAMQPVAVGTPLAKVSLDTNFANIAENFTALDNARVVSSALVGTDLVLTLGSGSTITTSIAAIQDGIGTDDQTITDFSLAGNTLSLTLEDGNTDTVDLSALVVSGGGDDLGTADAADISALFTGTTGWLNANGTVSTPTGTVPPGTDGQYLGYVGTTPTALDSVEVTPSADLTWNATTGDLGIATTIARIAQIDTQEEFETLLFTLPEGGGSISVTEQADDPLASEMATGDLVVATTSGDMFYRSATGLYTFTGGYEVVVPTYAMALAVTDLEATGDTFTVDGTPYDSTTSPYSITGLPTATEAITYNGTNTGTCTGDVTGTGPWVAAGEGADVACTVTVSSGATPDYQLDLEDASASKTLLATYGVNGTTAVGNTDTMDATTGCLDGGCFDLTDAAITERVLLTIPGTMIADNSFTFQVASKFSNTLDTAVRLVSATSNYLTLIHASNATDVVMYWRGTSLRNFTFPTLNDGNWHVIRITIDPSGTVTAYEGATEATLAFVGSKTGLTYGTLGGVNPFVVEFYGNSTANQGYAYLDAMIDYVKIWDGVVAP